MLPHPTYRHAAAAVNWLIATFGFTAHYRVVEVDGRIHTAQLHLGDAYIMVRNPGEGSGNPAELGGANQSLTVFVEDVGAHHARTKAAGAQITEELGETVYGERQYGVRDLEGHDWLSSQHSRDVDPATFTTVSQATHTAHVSRLFE